MVEIEMMFKVNSLALLLLSLSGVAYLWFAGIHLVGVHVPPIIAVISIYIAVTILFLKERFLISPAAEAILIVSFALVSWMFMRELLTGTDVLSALKVISGRVFVGILIAFSMLFLIDNVTSLRFCTYLLLAGITFSGIVGLGQYFIGEPFIRLWELTGGYLPRLGELQRGWIAGLASYSIPFSYQLCTFVPLVFGLISARSIKHKNVYFIIFLILVASLFLTQSRSAVVGAVIGMIVILWSVGWAKRLVHLSLFVCFAAVAYLLYGIYVNPRMITFTELSAQMRLPLFLAAVWTGFTNPLGTGRLAYLGIASSAYELVEELPSAEAVFVHTAHNQFLNILGYYGIPGLILLIVFYIFLFRLLRLKHMSLSSSAPGFLNGMRLGLLGGFVAYLVNSLFHNAGPFVGDPFHWYFIGLALATNKLVFFQLGKVHK